MIHDDSLAFGTEIVFEDDKANSGNVDCAAQHFPLPVTCNGKDVDRRDFLHDAVHVEQWRGIRLGVRSAGYHPGRRPELNFHGILIEDVRLPVICSMESHWHVKADVVDCAELELVLPARKSVVETPFVEQLRTACRTAVYRAMLKCDEQISVPADVRADALAHGVQLPVARAELAPWRPTYSNEYSTKRERPYRTALCDKPIVIEADMPPCDQVALWRAARRSDVSHRLCAEEPRYRGYPWYDGLTRARKLTTRVVLHGEEHSIEEERDKHQPFETDRPDRITFVLETVDGDGTVEHLCIPADVAFGDDDVSCANDVDPCRQRRTQPARGRRAARQRHGAGSARPGRRGQERRDRTRTGQPHKPGLAGERLAADGPRTAQPHRRRYPACGRKPAESDRPDRPDKRPDDRRTPGTLAPRRPAPLEHLPAAGADPGGDREGDGGAESSSAPSRTNSAGRGDPTQDLRRNILGMIQYALAIACGLNAITLEEGLRMKNQIAEWRARLRQPRGKGGARRRTRRRPTANTNRDRAAPTPPAAAEQPRDNSV